MNQVAVCESIRQVLDSVMFRSIQHSMNHLKSDSARGVNTSKAQNDALCLCRDHVQLHAEHIQLVIHTSNPLSRRQKIRSSQIFDVVKISHNLRNMIKLQRLLMRPIE